ncbi:MAG TPA: 5'-nucleotidase C-terminal domain-containing protein, partial [Vicinamibacterales bacterium]|nr:5'-nucleotidase C-terminal domain-containing protein [Vicinamibacterales bacterium]
TYQGATASNLSEGGVVIDAYNALGYTTAAIGNHDFEFGAVDVWNPRQETSSDTRGALKARAAQAHFPFLAANLREHDAPVTWPNVVPSALVDAAGVKVGLIGVMTYDALAMTLAANVVGLRVTALADAIVTEATGLRAAGATVVVVASHAGGECAAFDRPTDLGSCDDTAEMFEVVRRLPRGLVDVVMAGHTHAAVAHEVNGVAIAQAYSWGRAFSRVDVTVDRARARVAGVRIFPPQPVCARSSAPGRCAAQGTPAEYEGRPVVAAAAVEAAMAPALARVQSVRARPLGGVLAASVPRGTGQSESPLGNLFADAFRAHLPGTDVGLSYASGPGGLRADFAAGPATLGALYDVYPFDNRVVRRTLTGAELKQLLAGRGARRRFGGRALGVSGLRVRLSCLDGVFQAEANHETGEPVGDGERLVVAMSDFLAARAAAIAPSAAAPHAGEVPAQMRDVVTSWLGVRGGRVSAGEFADPAQPRWTQPASCGPI